MMIRFIGFLFYLRWILSPLSEADENPHSQTNSPKLVSRGRPAGGDTVLSFFTCTVKLWKFDTNKNWNIFWFVLVLQKSGLLKVYLIRRARGSAWGSFEWRSFQGSPLPWSSSCCCCCWRCCLPFWTDAAAAVALIAAAHSAALSASIDSTVLLLLLLLLRAECRCKELLKRVFLNLNRHNSSHLLNIINSLFMKHMLFHSSISQQSSSWWSPWRLPSSWLGFLLTRGPILPLASTWSPGRVLTMTLCSQIDDGFV